MIVAWVILGFLIANLTMIPILCYFRYDKEREWHKFPDKTMVVELNYFRSASIALYIIGILLGTLCVGTMWLIT